MLIQHYKNTKAQKYFTCWQRGCFIRRLLAQSPLQREHLGSIFIMLAIQRNLLAKDIWEINPSSLRTDSSRERSRQSWKEDCDYILANSSITTYQAALSKTQRLLKSRSDSFQLIETHRIGFVFQKSQLYRTMQSFNQAAVSYNITQNQPTLKTNTNYHFEQLNMKTCFSSPFC